MLGVWPPAVRCAYAVLGLLGVNTMVDDDVALAEELSTTQQVVGINHSTCITDSQYIVWHLAH